MSGGGALICGGSSCTVEEFEFPAGINHKLLFKTNTMINTVCGTPMPAENCTGYRYRENDTVVRSRYFCVGVDMIHDHLGTVAITDYFWILDNGVIRFRS